MKINGVPFISLDSDEDSKVWEDSTIYEGFDKYRQFIDSLFKILDGDHYCSKVTTDLLTESQCLIRPEIDIDQNIKSWTLSTSNLETMATYLAQKAISFIKEKNIDN